MSPDLGSRHTRRERAGGELRQKRRQMPRRSARRRAFQRCIARGNRDVPCERACRDCNRGDRGRRRSGHVGGILEVGLETCPVYVKERAIGNAECSIDTVAKRGCRIYATACYPLPRCAIAGPSDRHTEVARIRRCARGRRCADAA